MEDVVIPVPLISVNKETNNRYKLKTANLYDRGSSETIIHIVDPITKMAVFENTYGSYNDKMYQMFVPADKAKNYEMIVNYCTTQKQAEFRFDKTDFEKILNKE